MSAQPVFEQYDDVSQQVETYTVGMWLFLTSEIMFFGVLIVCYTVMRCREPLAFAAAGHTMKQTIGSINTLVLLTSSFTMALAVHFAKLRQHRQQINWMVCTALIGAVFVALKVFEWKLDAGEGHLPGMHFVWNDPHAGRVQAELFFFLYYTITGVHALHLTIGVIVVLTMALLIRRKFKLLHDDYVPTELVGLYWHYVDIVWIFLYPLFYLIPPPN